MDIPLKSTDAPRLSGSSGATLKVSMSLHVSHLSKNLRAPSEYSTSFTKSVGMKRANGEGSFHTAKSNVEEPRRK